MAEDLAKTSKKSTKIPLVSVVMSVYNGEKYLREAIDSILNQTFTDFEFIIINDGSTDNTLKIIKGYKDPRIVLISRKNKGLVASLNEGIEKAQGKYIARMDADDISHKERLQKQVELMAKGSSVIICGTFAARIDFEERKIGELVFPYFFPDVQRRLAIDNSLVHGSVLMKRLVAQKKYSEKIGPVEDYDLWLRALGGDMVIIPEFLYCYRDNPDGISQQKQLIQQESTEWLKLKINPILAVPNLWPLTYYRHLREYAHSSNIAKIYINDQKHLAQAFRMQKKYFMWMIDLLYYYSGRIILKLRSYE